MRDRNVIVRFFIVLLNQICAVGSVALVLFLALGSTQAQAIVIELTPPNQTISVGGTATLDVIEASSES